MRRRDSRANPRIFDARLLLELWDEHTDEQDIAAALGVNRRTVRMWRQGDPLISAYRADRLSIRIGTHPALVWGQQWWASAEDDDDRGSRERAIA